MDALVLLLRALSAAEVRAAIGMAMRDLFAVAKFHFEFGRAFMLVSNIARQTVTASGRI